MIKRTICFILSILFLASAVPVSARIINDVDLPELLTIDGNPIALNGGGTRVAFLNNVYVAGLYLQSAMTDPTEIIDANEPMAIRLQVINSFFASSKNITKALYKGFRGTVPKGDISSIEEDVLKFNESFSDDIVTGDIFEVVYIPNKGTSVYKNDIIKNTIPGYDFKKNVFGIWLGNRPADSDLMAGMLAGEMQVDVAQLKAAEAEKEAAAAAAQAEKQKAMELAAAEKAAAEQARAEADMKAAEDQARADAAKKAAEEKASLEAEKKAEQVKTAAATPVAKKTVATAAPAVKTASEFKGADVFFGFDDASLSGQAMQILDGKIEWMNANPDAAVIVEVYADPRGSAEYNMWLSEKRGKSVKAYMTGAGIDASRIELKIYGEENLQETGNTPQGWAKNRRAHLRVK